MERKRNISALLINDLTAWGFKQLNQCLPPAGCGFATAAQPACPQPQSVFDSVRRLACWQWSLQYPVSAWAEHWHSSCPHLSVWSIILLRLLSDWLDVQNNLPCTIIHLQVIYQPPSAIWNSGARDSAIWRNSTILPAIIRRGECHSLTDKAKLIGKRTTGAKPYNKVFWTRTVNRPTRWTYHFQNIE